jgi:maltooligosyltrehalose trehalohydrolase
MIYTTVYPVFSDENTIEFRVWAPKAKSMQLVVQNPEKSYEMHQQDFGYWWLRLENISSGTRYRYRIDRKESFPDPASLSQPEGVHEASEVIDLNDFEWTDQHWQNIPLKDMIQYELHTGTFTPEGTFAGIRSKLGYLKELGVNTIELLPVSQFSGERNWGYDGVYPFAVQNAYGGPKELMKLVNECHNQGIAVILDVVYNHFGPEGNYVGNFGHYFSGKYSTPWGDPINFDGAYSDGVRNYVIQNALMWCRDFHIDGLRLDAVHSIFDFSATHIMQALAENLNHLSEQTGRSHYLIAESHLNDVRYISPVSKGGYGLNAQWSDDFHHAVHTLATGEQKGYYIDFGQPGQLSKAIKKAFVYDGQYSEFRKKSYGNSTENNPGEQFVIFNQNHDQIGNRLLGDRLISMTDFETAKVIAGAMFVTPNVPMLFMGEEYGERNPFYYFVSHLDEELNRLVREGRKQEFEDFYSGTTDVPNPDDKEAFERSKLSWNIENDAEKFAMFRFYQTLIKLRKEHPMLKETDKNNLEISEDGKFFTLERGQGENRVVVFLNFEEATRTGIIPAHIKGNLAKIFDSTAFRKNDVTASEKVVVAANDKISVQEKSMVIFSK